MLVFDLQRFAGEKTERATPERRRQARREGQVPRSSELTSALTMLTGVILLRVSGPKFWNTWMNAMNQLFSNAGRVDLAKQGQVLALMHQNLRLMLGLLAPLLGAVMVVGAAAGFAQTGPMFLPNLLLPKFSRINPIEGWKRLFSLRASVEAGKSVLKLAIVGLVAYSATRGVIDKVALLTQTQVTSLPAVVGQIVFRLAIEIGILFVVLAFLDYLFQRFEFEKSIRMSRDDIKQEYRNQEGDPVIRSQLRQRGRALAMRRMMQDVPKADVVVTNPTHYAIALLYDAKTMNAPRVIAKGQDEMARRIREIATHAGVPLMENRILARALYREVEIGTEVPGELFRAVAEVLATVYRLREERVRR